MIQYCQRVLRISISQLNVFPIIKLVLFYKVIWNHIRKTYKSTGVFYLNAKGMAFKFVSCHLSCSEARRGKKKSINTSPSSLFNLAPMVSKEFLTANVQSIQISGSLTGLSTRSVLTEIVIKSPTMNFIHRAGLITEQVKSLHTIDWRSIFSLRDYGEQYTIGQEEDQENSIV